MAEDTVPRHGGGVIHCGDNQFAATQVLERALHGAFRKTGRFREHAQTRRHSFPFVARRLSVEMQINKIRGRLAIVPDEVAHQDINYVVIDWNCLAKSWHGGQITTIPINGQHFLRADPFGGWTAPFGSK